MKVKVIRDRKSKSQTLVIKPVKHEALEYDQAEWLRTYDGSGLVPFRYVRENEVTLYYDVTGLVNLKNYLKAEISLDQFRRILLQMAELLGTCTRRQLPTAAIQFDPEHVYIDAQGAPLFVFVPLSGVPERRESSPVAFLHYLGGRHVRFVVGEDDRHAMALEDFASRNQVLSLSALREFLQRDLGVTVHGDSGPLGNGSGGLGGYGGSVSLGGASAPASMTGSFGGYVAPAAPDSHPGYASSYRPPRPAGMGRGPQAGSAVAAFDPVAMLTGAASASQVVQKQAMGTRVRNAVGGKSPTAAVVSTGAAAPVAAMVPPAPGVSEVPGAGMAGAVPVAPNAPIAPVQPGAPVAPGAGIAGAVPVAPVQPVAAFAPETSLPADGLAGPAPVAPMQPVAPAQPGVPPQASSAAPVVPAPIPTAAPEAASASDAADGSYPAYTPRPGAPVPPEGIRPVAAAARSVASGRFVGMPSGVLRGSDEAGHACPEGAASAAPASADASVWGFAQPSSPESDGALQPVAAPAFASPSPVVPPAATSTPAAGLEPAAVGLDPAVSGVGGFPAEPAASAASAQAPNATSAPRAFAPARPASGGTTLLAGSAVASPVVSAFVPQARRLVLERASDGERFVLPSDAAVIGRSASSDVQVAGNTNISRSHVEVRRTGDGITLRDLGSANGTFAGGRRLERDESVQLRLGEPFRLADEDFRIVEE